MALYVGNSNTAATANAKLQTILASTAVNYNVFDAYGVQGNVTVADGATSPTNGNIAGLSGKVTFGNAVASAAISAGYFTLDGGHTGSNANGILIDVTGASTIANSLINASTTSGAVVTSGLVLGGTMTTGINMSGATISGEGIILPTQAKDATCTAGGIIYDGTNFWGCTATNTYTKLDN
jgi:phage baseplate assembly protein gpV